MRLRLLAAVAPIFALSSALAVGCATTAEVPDDAGSTPVDASGTRDSGPPRRDAEVVKDSGNPPPPVDDAAADSSLPPVDAGADAKDGGSPPPMDAGPPIDGGGGTTCQNATTLISGQMVSSSTTGAGDDYDYGPTASLACDPEFGLFTYDGPDVAFKYTIPAGKTLKIDASSLNQWDIAVGIVTNCAMAGASCVAGSDVAGNGAETVSYKNNGNQPLPVFIIVDSYLPTEHGPFTILATEM